MRTEDYKDMKKLKMRVYVEKESGTLFYLDENGELISIDKEYEDYEGDEGYE